MVHLLERTLRGFRKEEIEEDSVGEITDLWIFVRPSVPWSTRVTYNEQEIVFPSSLLHGRLRDLPDHGVECERYHRSNGNAFRTSLSVKDLGWNDPRQRSTGCTEAEIVNPSDDNETPSSRLVVACPWWEYSQHYSGNDEGNHVSKITNNEWPATSEFVDEEDAKRLSYQSDDGRDCLVL